MPTRNILKRYSFAVEKDAYRKRFDTSDAIILPMVQKGKVEETIIESIPQLVIQLVNTWLLGELQSMPGLTIFSISLSVISLTNTVWYYAYWNLFRCMPIRDVPSTLSLYNYKLSGVTDGAFSFAKASSEVVEIELSEIEKMRGVTVSGTVLNDDDAGDEQLGQLPPKNAMAELSAVELTRMSGGMGVLNASVGVSQGARDPNAGAVENDAEIHRLREENHEKEAEIATLRDAKTENEAFILKLLEEKRQMEAEINKMRLELQRLPSIALESVDSCAQDTLLSTHAAAAAAGSINDGDISPDSPRGSRAAVTLQSVTRGHLGRRLFQARMFRLLEEKRQVEADHSSNAVETQRMSSIALDSVDSRAQDTLHSTDITAAAGSINDGDSSPVSPRVTRAAVTLQSVTRGHLGRQLFQARCRQVAQQLLGEQL